MKDLYVLVYSDTEGYSTYKYFDNRNDLEHYAKKHNIKGDIYKKAIYTWPKYIGYTKG